ncbi:MAG: hypothetical protein IJN65_02040 [Clostridia bacterium]|nr:hypothetical protein [Clostridia bacterium]
MSKKIMMLLSIVELDKGKKLIKELQNNNIRINLQTVGFGTAPSELMDIFGLGSKDKDVVISMGAEDSVRELLSNMGAIFSEHTKYGGLMIALDVCAASRVLCEILSFNTDKPKDKGVDDMKNEHLNDLIIISVNEGYTEEVMRSARHAGATGGTVIKGRLADSEQLAEFVGTKVDGEREIILILTPASKSAQIMEAVNKDFGITSAANGTVLAVPAQKAYKI